VLCEEVKDPLATKKVFATHLYILFNLFLLFLPLFNPPQEWLFLLAARHSASKTCPLRSLRSVGCRQKVAQKPRKAKFAGSSLVVGKTIATHF
jgi:hypothetical protein